MRGECLGVSVEHEAGGYAGPTDLALMGRRCTNGGHGLDGLCGPHAAKGITGPHGLYLLQPLAIPLVKKSKTMLLGFLKA